MMKVFYILLFVFLLLFLVFRAFKLWIINFLSKASSDQNNNVKDNGGTKPRIKKEDIIEADFEEIKPDKEKNKS